MKNAPTALTLAILLAFPMVAAAQVTPSPAVERTQGSNETYAQQLVATTARLHPELLAVDLHATLPGASQSTIIATDLNAPMLKLAVL